MTRMPSRKWTLRSPVSRKCKPDWSTSKSPFSNFKKNEVKEKAFLESVHSFKGSLGKWWNKSHDTIYTSASNSAIFIGAAGLLHTIGLDNGAALAIVGSFIGGETVAKVLKSLPRGLFTKQS